MMLVHCAGCAYVRIQSRMIPFLVFTLLNCMHVVSMPHGLYFEILQFFSLFGDRGIRLGMGWGLGCYYLFVVDTYMTERNGT